MPNATAADAPHTAESLARVRASALRRAPVELLERYARFAWYDGRPQLAEVYEDAARRLAAEESAPDA